MELADFAVTHSDSCRFAGPGPISGLPKVASGKPTANSGRPARATRWRLPAGGYRGLSAVGCLLLAFLAACSRTARPVEIPDGLEAWPTVLETPRRAPWILESAPLHPERAWTAEMGRGMVGPLAIEAGLLFATSIDRRLMVIDRSDGEFFWERRLAGAAPAGAVFDRTTVFVASQDRDGSAEAYELARGFLVWREEIPPPVGAPLLHDGLSFWGTETGRIYALAVDDGTRAWRIDLHGGVIGSPVLDGTDLLVATNADSLYRIEARSGRILHRLALPATPTGTPAFDGRFLHLPLHDTTYAIVDVQERRIAATFRTGSVVRSTPVLDDAGSAWVLTEAGTVLRVDTVGVATIAELGGAARASLALAANGILVGRLDGALFLLDYDGSVIWREDFDDSIEAPVAIHDGAVYVPLLRGELVVLREAGS